MSAPLIDIDTIWAEYHKQRAKDLKGILKSLFPPEKKKETIK